MALHQEPPANCTTCRSLVGGFGFLLRRACLRCGHAVPDVRMSLWCEWCACWYGMVPAAMLRMARGRG